MQYLEYMFEKTRDNPDIVVSELLPWSSTIPDSCKNKKVKF